jgi:TorA maturation chaperone TorD
MTTTRISENIAEPAASETIDNARLLLYRFLSLALSDPRSIRWPQLLDEHFQECVATAADLLASEPTARNPQLAPGELPPNSLTAVEDALQLLDRPFSESAEDYDRTFGLVVSKKCPPYESEFCPQTFSVYRSQHLADIAGFYNAFGLQPSRDMPERHDHIALELEFMSWLIVKEFHARENPSAEGKERAEICRDAQRKFFSQHLAWWAPAFAFALVRRSEGATNVAEMAEPPNTFYGAAARVLAAFVAVERVTLDVPPPTELVGARATDETDPASCEGCGIAAF